MLRKIDPYISPGYHRYDIDSFVRINESKMSVKCDIETCGKVVPKSESYSQQNKNFCCVKCMQANQKIVIEKQQKEEEERNKKFRHWNPCYVGGPTAH